MAWSGAITLLENVWEDSGSGSAQSITSESFTPPANSLLFDQHSHSANSVATVPDVQLTNTGGLTFARYVTEVRDFAGTNDIQSALFIAPVGGSPSSMTVTVDPLPGAGNAYQSMLIYSVTEGEILQGPEGRISEWDGATTHTTAALPVATTSGNLVIAGFSTHTTGGTVPSAPSGFTLLASTGTNYQMNTVFYSTSFVGTEVTCTDLGESLFVTASWIMEIETPAPSGPQSVRFNAFDDHYSRAATGLESSDFTMACWAYLSADRNTANFFLGADASSNWHSVGVHSDGTELYWSSTSGNTRTGAQLAVGAWYYVAIIYSASGTDTIYWGADGAALSSDSTTTSGVMSGITSGFTFHIGNTRDSEWWNGRIAQVKVWTAALSQAEIEAERDLDGVARTTNLWAYYSFRDGPQTNDESGNGRTLTAAGTLTAEAGPPVEAPVALDPIGVAGCQFWFDAADASTFTFSSGTVVSAWNDKSGNARHLAVVGGATPDRGVNTLNSLPVVNFNDGKLQWLAAGSNISTTTLTVAVVYRLPAMIDDSRLVSIADYPNADWAAASGAAAVAGDTDSWPRPYRDGSGYLGYLYPPVEDTWLVCYSIWDGTNHTLYIDNTATTAPFASTGTFNFDHLAIGDAVQSGEDPFVGDVAEIAIYSQALDATERADLFTYFTNKWMPYDVEVLADDPWVYCKLESFGATTHDSSGNGRTVNVNTNFSAVTGIVGSGYAAVGGDTAACLIPQTQTTNPPGTYSLECWFRTNVACHLMWRGSQYIVNNYTGDEDQATYVDTSGNINLRGWNSAGGSYINVATSGTDYRDNAWHHVVVTESPANGKRIYVDGAIEATGAYAMDTGTSASYLHWGGGYDGGMPGWAAGMSRAPINIDECAFYTTELSAARVLAHYEAAVPAEVALDPIGIAGCQLWLDADDDASFTLSGSAVMSWGDKTGLGHHAVETGTSTQRPQRTATIGGLPAVAFDGGDLLVTTAPANLKPMTIVAVVNMTAGASPRTILGATAVAGWQFVVDGADNLQLNRQATAIHVWSILTVPEGEPSLITLTYGSGGAWVTRLNGVQIETGTNDASPSVASFLVGAQTTGAAEGWTGSIGEIVVYDSQLTGTDLTDLETYLTDKWFAEPAGGGVFFGSTALAAIKLGVTNIVKAFLGAVQVWPDGGGATALPTTDLIVHLDASTLALSNTDPVSSWTDVSPVGTNHATQTGTNRPTYIASGLNGLPTVRFDGTDDYLTMPDGFSTWTAGFTLFFVVTPAAAPTNNEKLISFSSATSRVIACGRSGTTAIAGMFAYNSSDAVRYFNGSTGSFAPGVGAVHSFHNPAGAADAAVTGEIRKDNVSVGTGDMYIPPVVTRTDNFIGVSWFGPEFFDGDFSEVLIYNRALTEPEITQVYDYLNDKYFPMPAPLLAYNFTESGTSATDRSGNGRNATMLAGSTPTDLHSSGEFAPTATGHRLSYDAASDAAARPVNASVVVKIRMPATVGAGNIWARMRAGNSSTFNLFIDSGSTLWAVVRGVGGSGAAILNAGGLSANTSYTVALTYDGTTSKLYRNGTLTVSDPTTAGDLDWTGTNFKWQSYDHDDDPLVVAPFFVDDLRFYGVALTAAQVASLVGVPVT